MRKPNLKRLKKEIEELQVNKRKSYNSALNIIMDKYDFKDIFELKETLYSEELNLSYDLSIIIKENLANSGRVVVDLYNRVIELKTKISNRIDEDDEKFMLLNEHNYLLSEITDLVMGDNATFYTFIFTEDGFTLYLYDDPKNPCDYTCLVEYIEKESKYNIGQRKETKLF